MSTLEEMELLVDVNLLTPAQAARALFVVARSRWAYADEVAEPVDWFFDCLAAIGGVPDPVPEDALGISATGHGTVCVARIQLADCLLEATLDGTLPVHWDNVEDLDEFLFALRLYIANQQGAA